MGLPIPVPSPQEIREYINHFTQWIKKREWQKLKEKMSEARSDNNLYDFLRWLYPSENVPVKHGLSYPVALYMAPKRQWNDPESVLDGLDLQSPELTHHNLRKAGEAYRKMRTAQGANMWNGHTYRLLKLETDKRLKMHCGLGRYFTAFETCDILELELLTKFAEKHPSNLHEFYSFFCNELKLRHLVQNCPITEPKERSAAIAISTLVIFRDGNHFKTILWERSGTVGPHSDLTHVLPSLMFQPVVDDFSNEFSVRHNIYREYLEELFDVPEVRMPQREPFYNYFYQNPNLKFLRTLEKEKRARIVLTGVSINLLNLRPEICTLLLIDDNVWRDKHSGGDSLQRLAKLSANEEFKTIEELHAEGKSLRVLLDLERDFSFPKRDELSPSKMVPPGAAALIMGLEVAKQILQV